MRITDEQYNAIKKLISRTKNDSIFDICSKEEDSAFYDYEFNEPMIFQSGLELLFEVLTEPISRDDLTFSEANLIISLFKDYNIGEPKAYRWLLSNYLNLFEL